MGQGTDIARAAGNKEHADPPSYPEDYYKLGKKPRSIGLIIFLNNTGVHPEIGRDFWGTTEEYDQAIYWQYKYEPIEDEI